MVVDTSAIMAVLLQEPDAAVYAEALEADGAPLLSTATFVELAAVAHGRFGARGKSLIDRFLRATAMQIEPLSLDQAHLAHEAYARYRVLNFGDCLSYALAKDKNLPLLFKGDDFSQTDVLQVDL